MRRAVSQPPKPRRAALARQAAAVVLTLLLAACGSAPIAPAPDSAPPRPASERRPASDKGSEVTLFALGLINTGYRFGGKNPAVGLDCSGMVSYIYRQAVGLNLTGNAADQARRGRPIDRKDLRPGDLVFFNTRNAPFSHVGIYIGDQRFIHAPSTNGRVRIDLLTADYYARRFEAARAFFD